ncbi:DUF6924 domain-containing protein [Actinomadura napierensis]|uniref:DUF6924 domain-containing protein n=1 Tax=Actinomadura napierensis TaxID=267854 RepID=A0ABN3A2V4_9ACTN
MLPSSQSTLLIRTDFSDQDAWEALRTAVRTPNEEGFTAEAVFIDDRAYQGLGAQEILPLVSENSGHRLLALADGITLTSPEMPLLVIDLEGEPPGRIRVVTAEFWSIENNLSLYNMDFDEFAESVDADGTYRGF